MKFVKFVGLSCLGAVLLFSGEAMAGSDYGKQRGPIEPLPTCGPWFSGLSGGAFWVEDFTTPVPFPGDHEFSFDGGWGGTLTPVGYRVCEMFAVSLSVGYYEAETESITLPGGFAFPATGGELNLVPLMVNGVLTFPITDSFSIYAGGGIGAVYHEFDITSAPLAFFEQDDWSFALQGVAGVAVEVAPCVHLTAGYRYQHIFTNDGGDIQGHSAEIGITFTWGS